MEHEEMQQIGDKVVAVLKTIYDPEIPVDIFELGLVYDVQLSDQKEAKILMTLTSPNCPVAESLPAEVAEKVEALDEIDQAAVELTFDPPWSQDMMSEAAKLELGFL
ncbi:MAG: iron-sulfur cluster assembly protein [Flavobacteriales bacterium]